MQQERTLSYELAQKLDEADVEEMSGGSSADTQHWTHQGNSVDYRWDS